MFYIYSTRIPPKNNNAVILSNYSDSVSTTYTKSIGEWNPHKRGARRGMPSEINDYTSCPELTKQHDGPKQIVSVYVLTYGKAC